MAIDPRLLQNQRLKQKISRIKAWEKVVYFMFAKVKKIQFPKRRCFTRQHSYMQSPFQQRARGKILKQEKMVRRKQKTEKEV